MAVAPSVVIVIVLVMVFFSDISRKFMLFVGLVQTGIVLVGISNSYGSDNINGGGTACWWCQHQCCTMTMVTVLILPCYWLGVGDGEGLVLMCCLPTLTNIA